MTSGRLLKMTVGGCAALAAIALAAGFVTGHPGAGAGLAAGLVLGSANGYLLQGLMARRTPFVASSLMRIVFFTSLVLVAALAFRSAAWSIALGLGLAQLVMVAAGMRQALRA